MSRQQDLVAGMTTNRKRASPEATYIRLLSGFTLLLLASTWKLWGSGSEFPQVPLVSWAVAWHPALDALFAAIFSLLLLLALLRPGSRRQQQMVLGTAVLSEVLLWVGDQHRLQPWAYHFALAAWVLVVSPADQRRTWLRWIAISVYFYSALNKFDRRFLETTGPLFIATGLDLFGAHPAGWTPLTLGRLAWLLPLGELCTAGLLAVPKFRPAGRLAATVLHVTLLAVLGPWGLDQRWGVLWWNVSFLLQTNWLFRASAEPTTEPNAHGTGDPPRLMSWRWGLMPVVIALAMPMLEPWGCWDPWLSWGLYSARAPKAELWIAREAVADLPVDLQRFCEPAPQGIWAKVASDRWSLEVLQVPLYPHDRFQVGVCWAVVNTLPSDRRWFTVALITPPDRWTGQSSELRISGEDELRYRAASYRWNARPRPWHPASTSRAG